MDKKIIGITMGDPLSVGPEITVKLLQDENIYKKCNPVVIGDVWTIERALKYVGVKDIKIKKVYSIDECKFEYKTIDVYQVDVFNPNEIGIGEVSKIGGEASFQYVIKVIELAMEGKIDATVTNAISKEAINLAGHHYSGHTEIYAEYTNTKKYCMMLCHESLRVAHVSTHVSLREACDRCKKDRILEVIRLADEACKAINIQNPKVAVAGLNPHAGENGMFGGEEKEEIIPAIESAKAEGMNVEGPIPPDTVFSKARGGMYDIVVVMYHDQGHIPLKVVGFVYDNKIEKWQAVEGVNITLGLPIIRVSVDHGTAFDQAGTGKGNALSLVNAVEYSILFANKK